MTPNASRASVELFTDPGSRASSAVERARRIRSTAPIRQQADVEFRVMPVRSILNENKNRRLRFRWTINPYRGCEFGCSYCYARTTHEYLDHLGGDFEHRIYVKDSADVVLARTLRPERLRGQQIAIGTATDPYQGAERRFRVTRRLLEVLSRSEGLDLAITTKSPLVVEDIDLLQHIARRSRLRVNLTIATLDHGLARLLEDKAPTPESRLAAMRQLSEAGITVVHFCMPILPGINDREESLRALLTQTRAAGAIRAEGAVLHLEAAARKVFFPLLRRHFPHLWTAYQRCYTHGRYVRPDVRDRIEERFRMIRREVGFAEAPTTESLRQELLSANLSDDDATARQLSFAV